MKKFLVVLLSIMCVFSLTACGGGNDAEVNDDGSIVVKLGCSGPLSGDAKTYGEAVRNAAQIAVDEINASDSKIKFDFKMEDDEADGEKAVSAYSSLYDWGMQVSLLTVIRFSALISDGAATAFQIEEMVVTSSYSNWICQSVVGEPPLFSTVTSTCVYSPQALTVW